MAACLCGSAEDVAVVAPHALKDDAHLATLCAALQGPLALFGTDEYEAARFGKIWDTARCGSVEQRKAFSPENFPTETWNVDAAGLPAAICSVASVADVQACVKYCAAAGETLCIAGGRHSHTCMVSESFVIDLQRLRGARFELRDGQGYLTVEGGALNGDAHGALDGKGWCMTLGHHPGTGLGGLVQQGGHGPLEKTMGLSIDAMVEADVVLASGELRTCSLTTEEDLFWAVRGGCGNFGVVTRFEFALYPFEQHIPSLQRVHLPLPLFPSRGEILRNFRDQCDAMPRTVSPLLILTPFPVIEMYYGIGRGDTLDAVKPYDTFGSPVSVTCQVRDYINEAAWDILGPSSDQSLADDYYPTSAFLGGLPDAACEIIAEYSARMPPHCGLVLNQLGGAAADVKKDATSVYHRDGAYWLIINCSWKGTLFSSAADERAKTITWAKALRGALAPWSAGRYGALAPAKDEAEYFNDATDSEDPLAQASWGANYPRLRKLKRKYDPENLFRHNHNIAPAEAD